MYMDMCMYMDMRMYMEWICMYMGMYVNGYVYTWICMYMGMYLCTYEFMFVPIDISQPRAPWMARSARRTEEELKPRAEKSL
jgi:hypothetical protein